MPDTLAPDIAKINARIVDLFQCDPRRREALAIDRDIARLVVEAQRAGRYVQLVGCERCDAYYPLVAESSRAALTLYQTPCLACGMKSLKPTRRERVTRPDGTQFTRTRRMA